MAENPESRPPLTAARRQAVFRAVVQAQDAGLTDDLSRKWVGERFAITAWQVAAIEAEGIQSPWPLVL